MDEIMKINGEREVVSAETDILALAEKRAVALEKMASLAITRTNASDWVDMQGKPYLSGSGSEKVARVFGVKIHSVKSAKTFSEDEQGAFYIYEYSGVAELPSKFDSIEAVGSCSSRDQFFAKKGGERKKLSQVDETNIMKAAYTNFLGNAITRLLGIRNLTWEEVEKLSGGKIKHGSTSKVEYNSGAKTGDYLISEAQAKRLYAISKSVGVSHEAMKAFLSAEYKIESSRDIKREWYEAICEAVQNGKAKKYEKVEAEIDVDADAKLDSQLFGGKNEKKN